MYFCIEDTTFSVTGREVCLSKIYFSYLLLQAPVMSRYLLAKQLFGHFGGSM